MALKTTLAIACIFKHHNIVLQRDQISNPLKYIKLLLFSNDEYVFFHDQTLQNMFIQLRVQRKQLEINHL